jgi:hypothetical protein
LEYVHRLIVLQSEAANDAAAHPEGLHITVLAGDGRRHTLEVPSCARRARS